MFCLCSSILKQKVEIVLINNRNKIIMIALNTPRLVWSTPFEKSRSCENLSGNDCMN